MKNEYIQGFMDKCAALGVDADELVKLALGTNDVPLATNKPPVKVKAPAKPKKDLSGTQAYKDMYGKTYDQGKLPAGIESPKE